MNKCFDTIKARTYRPGYTMILNRLKQDNPDIDFETLDLISEAGNDLHHILEYIKDKCSEWNLYFSDQEITDLFNYEFEDDDTSTPGRAITDALQAIEYILREMK